MVNDVSELNRSIIENFKTPSAPRENFYRPNLSYEIERVSNEGEKRLSLVRLLRENEGAGIVYVATAKEARSLTEYLNRIGFDAAPYHEELDSGARRRTLDRFIAGELKAMVVPNKSGPNESGPNESWKPGDEEQEFVMGALCPGHADPDRPDIRFVIHYNMPMSLDAYYQESCGAGRSGRSARCTLMFQIADRRAQSLLTSGPTPKTEEVTAVYAALERLKADKTPVELERIQAGVSDVARVKVRSALSLLKDMGFIKEHRGARYALLKRELVTQDMERLAGEHTSRSRHAREKLERMTLYAQSPECRWKLLLEHLGAAMKFEECGHCDNCRRPAHPARAGAAGSELIDRLFAYHQQEEARIKPGDVVKLPEHGEVRVKAVEGDKIVVSLPGGATRKFKQEWVIR
jgi:ATP-dependent DNA helicase RecQ